MENVWIPSSTALKKASFFSEPLSVERGRSDVALMGVSGISYPPRVAAFVKAITGQTCKSMSDNMTIEESLLSQYFDWL
jgi:hypothetical protein